MIVLNKVKKPTKIYAEVIEDGALTQFISAMECDFAIRGALMPDFHQGYSLPIGGVVETNNMIVPSWIGFDIGCGMCAVPTDFEKDDIKDNAEEIHAKILQNVPVGFSKRDSAPTECKLLPRRSITMENIYRKKQGDLQLGTLGGGK